MSEKTYQDHINRRTREEVEAFERDPTAKAQRQLDWFWQARLDARAAARRRIERPGAVDPGSGIYDPIARLENENRA
jgi:hypothetical protein